MINLDPISRFLFTDGAIQFVVRNPEDCSSFEHLEGKLCYIGEGRYKILSVAGSEIKNKYRAGDHISIIVVSV